MGRTHLCGDGVLDDSEQCDLGSVQNDGRYGGCNPDCTTAARCGDGVVDSRSGETCDDGVDHNLDQYGGCNAECRRAAYCGNGGVDGPEGTEECDDGNTNPFDGCSKTCQNESILE